MEEISHRRIRFGRSIFSPAVRHFFKGRSETFSFYSDSGTDSFDDARIGFVPMLNQEVEVDDNDAVIVLVFPRAIKMNLDREIEEPLKEVHKIFVHEGAVVLGTDCFPDRGPLSAREYQDIVRAKLIQVLNLSGLKLTSFESIDRDEAFLKIGIDPNGEVLQQLASNYLYKMPFNDDAYEVMEPCGVYPGSEPITDWFGTTTYAYHEYEPSLKEQFQPFRDVDIIRLVWRRLEDWLDFAELERQDIVTRYFPGAKHSEVVKLHYHWASLRHSLRIPRSRTDDMVRDYFGEKTAFLFKYFAFYIHMLIPLTVIAILVVPVEASHLNFSYHVQNYVKVAFGLIIVIWSTCFKKLFEYYSTRLRQRWGMQDFDTNYVRMVLSTYRADLDGTLKWHLHRLLGHFVVFAFCASFAYCHFLLSKKALPYNELLMTVLTQGSSLLWGYVAGWLVNMQNHRTQDRYDNALIKKLSFVKLFLYLWPFLRYAFLLNWEVRTCAGTLDEAVDLVFQHHPWPTGVEKSRYHEWLPEYTFAYGNQTCVWGCVPVKCNLDMWANGTSKGTASCLTSCYYTLQLSLDLLYFSHVGCTIIFVFFPIFRTGFAARREIWRAQNMAREEPLLEHSWSDTSPDSNGCTHDDSPAYSYLQFQAKCHKQAQYKYLQWGGSYVEDFQEVVIGFALMTCFGIIHPALVVFAFVSQIVEYRLLAYRMTNVTCRPFPAGSEGIGMWSRVIDIVGVLACLINAGLAAFVMRPMTRYSWTSKCIGFFVIQNALFLVRFLIPVFIPEMPSDVKRIADFNAEVVRKLVRKPVLRIPESESHCSRAVDIGLQPSREASS